MMEIQTSMMDALQYARLSQGGIAQDNQAHALSFHSAEMEYAWEKAVQPALLTADHAVAAVEEAEAVEDIAERIGYAAHGSIASMGLKQEAALMQTVVEPHPRSH